MKRPLLKRNRRTATDPAISAIVASQESTAGDPDAPSTTGWIGAGSFGAGLADEEIDSPVVGVRAEVRPRANGAETVAPLTPAIHQKSGVAFLPTANTADANEAARASYPIRGGSRTDQQTAPGVPLNLTVRDVGEPSPGAAAVGVPNGGDTPTQSVSDALSAALHAVDQRESAKKAESERLVSEPVPTNALHGFDFGDTPLAREISDLARRRSALAAITLPLPVATRVFTIANQKGGVGKTTTAVNLAAALARTGARVLVIDLDPQGNASTALGVEHRAETPSVYDVVIGGESMAAVVQASPLYPTLFCVPATIHLAGAEIELVSLESREQRLRTALETFLNAAPEPFHYVFIDCPPSLGLLTINAFVSASEVLIPIQCEYYALEGLSQLLGNIALIEKHLNPALKVSTILLTMFDSRTNLANQVAQEVREHFPNQVLRTLIPRSVRISEAPSYGQTVISYDTYSAGSLSYQEAAAEIAQRGAPN